MKQTNEFLRIVQLAHHKMQVDEIGNWCLVDISSLFDA
jgi:hypothetical protein